MMCWTRSSATLPMPCQISMFILCNQSCLTHGTSGSSWPHFFIVFFRVSFILDSLPAPRITPNLPLPPALLLFLLECLSVFLSHSLYPNSLNNLIETQNFHSKLMTLFSSPQPTLSWIPCVYPVAQTTRTLGYLIDHSLNMVKTALTPHLASYKLLHQ